jgi:hypothetical protein
MGSTESSFRHPLCASRTRGKNDPFNRPSRLDQGQEHQIEDGDCAHGQCRPTQPSEQAAHRAPRDPEMRHDAPRGEHKHGSSKTGAVPRSGALLGPQSPAIADHNRDRHGHAEQPRNNERQDLGQRRTVSDSRSNCSTGRAPACTLERANRAGGRPNAIRRSPTLQP